MRAVGHTRSMTVIRSSSLQSFRELSAEVRTLLFIYASAAWARRNENIPNTSMLVEELERVWRTHELSADAVSDPDRMTLLLEGHFERMHSEQARTAATENNTSQSKESR